MMEFPSEPQLIAQPLSATTGFRARLLAQHRDYPARVMEFITPHGRVQTPAFMPVGTRAVVNNISSPDLMHTQSQIILGGNTYHMLLAPELEVIFANGGMHKFMNWQGPMLTDSGGFQVFSFAKKSASCEITEAGVSLHHPQSGRQIHMTPVSSIQAQKIIGADIIMAFDHCVPDSASRAELIDGMERTHRWLIISKETHVAQPNSAYGWPQALFGIVQGGLFRDLREKSTEFLLNLDLDGIAIGGETIGFNMPKTVEILNWLEPLLPKNKIRYTMGVGLEPQNLLDVSREGIDIYDCVAPTRNARHGSLYCGEIVPVGTWLQFRPRDADSAGKIAIKKSIYANDQNPIMPDCECFTCKHYTRADLHFYFKSNSLNYTQLACIHNIHVMQAVCKAMRECIFKYKS